MSYKLDKYVIKSLESIKSYVLNNSDIMVPDIYLQKLSQYGGKISTNDVIFEVYSLLLDMETKKLCSKVLSNVLNVFIMCGPYVPDEPSLKIFIANIYVDVLFALIVASCQKKVCPKKLMELVEIVCKNYLDDFDVNFNFSLTEKIGGCGKPLLTVLKLLNRKNKSDKYVDFLRSNLSVDENGLLNEQLGGMYDEAILLNKYDQINLLNGKLLEMVGGVDGPKPTHGYDFRKALNTVNNTHTSQYKVTMTESINNINVYYQEYSETKRGPKNKAYWYFDPDNGNHYYMTRDNVVKMMVKERQKAEQRSRSQSPVQKSSHSGLEVSTGDHSGLKVSTGDHSGLEVANGNHSGLEVVTGNHSELEGEVTPITIAGVEFIPGKITLEQTNVVLQQKGFVPITQEQINNVRTEYLDGYDSENEELL